ncbi:hypothetical protein [Aeromonas enteropelogenes]|uniref:hypothetical protein n=1 Tax=Aeromonas enteropelogenes TaxID=29489 RepID=UPI003B9E7A6A
MIRHSDKLGDKPPRNPSNGQCHRTGRPLPAQACPHSCAATIAVRGVTPYY